MSILKLTETVKNQEIMGSPELPTNLQTIQEDLVLTLLGLSLVGSVIPDVSGDARNNVPTNYTDAFDSTALGLKNVAPSEFPPIETD